VIHFFELGFCRPTWEPLLEKEDLEWIQDLAYHCVIFLELRLGLKTSLDKENYGMRMQKMEERKTKNRRANATIANDSARVNKCWAVEHAALS